jgi:flagellar basal body P-ring formation protein FlgA
MILMAHSSFRNLCIAAVVAAIAVCGLAANAFAAGATEVQLKPSLTIETADIRLGDLFDGAGDAGMAVFGMAPGPGRTMSYSANYVQAKAKQAGLDWKNEAAIATVEITRSGSAPVKTAQAPSVRQSRTRSI